MSIQPRAALVALAALCTMGSSVAQIVQHPPKDVVNVDGVPVAKVKGTSSQDLFPSATGDLVIEWPADGVPPAMAELAHRYGELTGQLMVMTQQTRDLLQQTRLPLDRPTTVPAAGVQSFFESVMFASDFVLTIVREEAPRLVQIDSLQTTSRTNIRAHARLVPAKDLELLRRHPAMLFTTVVDLPNLDVRQVANSMRTMITDANTMQMLPAGNSSTMVLTGFGPQVAGLVEHLRLIDAGSVVPASKVTITHEVIRLQHAIASDTAALVERALISAREQRSGVSASGSQQANAQSPPPTASVLADVRLNALLVTCPADELADARRVIALLDVK